MTVPLNMLPSRTPAQLINIARLGLEEAGRTGGAGLRYAAAHLAALRAGAALLAARAEPGRHDPRARVRSVWDLLVEVAPEFGAWAAHFADTSTRRATAEAGIPRMVTDDEADAMLAAATQFVDVVAADVAVAR